MPPKRKGKWQLLHIRLHPKVHRKYRVESAKLNISTQKLVEFILEKGVEDGLSRLYRSVENKNPYTSGVALEEILEDVGQLTDEQKEALHKPD